MAKRIVELFVALQLCLVLFTIQIYCIESTRQQQIKYVIFDTDMGADDAWALQMLLTAEKEFQNVKVLGITTVSGNTDVIDVIKNTYRILDDLNRTDIPIYKGASEAIIPLNAKSDDYFGKNGFGNIDIWKPQYPDLNSIIQEKNAVEIIRDLVMKYPHRISLLCVGPLTNIALAIKTYPEIQKNIKSLASMGGSYTGRGNVVPFAEFNYYMDPEAAFIILNSSIRPIWNLPLDVCDDQFTTKWRFDVVGKENGPNVKLLNEIEMLPLHNQTSYCSYDPITAAAFLFPEKIIINYAPVNATIELHGYYTRGEMLVNRQSTDYNVFIIEKISAEEFKKIMMWAAS